MFKKIFGTNWVYSFSVSGISFGPVSIDELHSALLKIQTKKGYIADPKLEEWLLSSKYMSNVPIEILSSNFKGSEAFKFYMESFDPGSKEFFDKNPRFYLWVEPSAK